VNLLVDTSAILALARARDRNHVAAREFLRRNDAVRFVLPDLVFAEVATRMRAWEGAGRTVRMITGLLRSQRYSLVSSDAELFQRALDEMARFADKRLSFADCASFVWMRRLGLRAAFTFDADFRDCGFAMVP
jgi:predicted nucleic acid-binding protein